MEQDSHKRSQLIMAFRGSRLLAGFLWICSAFSILLLIGAISFPDWSGTLILGLTAAFAVYMCLGLAWGESIARAEIRTDGFSIRLPRYRGVFPSLGVQHLDARWEDLTGIWQWRVRARCFYIIPTDYILHRIVTKKGSLCIAEPLWYGDKAARSLPVARIIQNIREQGEIAPYFAGDINGFGVLYGILFGGPRQQRRKGDWASPDLHWAPAAKVRRSRSSDR